MPSNVILRMKDSWLDNEFVPYEGAELPHIYRTLFQLQFLPQVKPEKVYVNDDLLHTFLQPVAHFDFTLMPTKPLLTVTVHYTIEEEAHEALFHITVDPALLPSAGYLEQLRDQYLLWQQKVQDYVDVYGESEIELAEFYSDEDWQVSFKQLQDRLKIDDPDAIWFYVFRKEITLHLQQILRKPKVKLTTEEMLVNAAELDVITPRTIQHFMKDTTTWAKSTMARPVPQQLLKEVHEESIDIYENRFIYTFADQLEREMRKVIKELKDNVLTIQTILASNELKIELDILRFDAELESMQLLEYEELFSQALSQLTGLYNLVRKTIKTFRGLKFIQGYVVPNQVLLYNKDYGTLYRFYNHYMRAMMDKTFKLNDSIDYQTYYADEVLFTMLHQLQQEGFVHDGPLTLKLGEELNAYIFSKEAVTFSLHHAQFGVKLTIERSGQKITVTVQHEQTKKVEVSRFLPTLFQLHKYVTEAQIEALYTYTEQSVFIENKNKRKELITNVQMPTVMVVYPAKTKDDYFKAMPYEKLHLVMTLGTNFISAEKFQAFGAMKYGVFPYSTADFNKQLFKRFIRLQLYKIGVQSFCFMCGADGHETNEGEYVCGNPLCRCEWGTRTCKCGAPLYKMQKKSMKDDVYLTEEQQLAAQTKSDVNWLFEKENINATMGLNNLCENAHLGTSFFTVCANCGDCQQQSKAHRICKRCDAMQRTTCNLEVSP